MLTRKGQLGWVFLCVIVISLVISTFFIFASFRNKADDSSEQFAVTASESLYSRQYTEEALRFVVLRALRETTESDFRTSFENRFMAFMQEYNPGDGRYGTFFGDVSERKTYTIQESGGIYTLRVPSIQQTTRSPNGRHQITRTFDLEVRFTRDGLL